MKKILFALAAMFASGALYAQNSLVATLTSGSNVTAFYGETALAQALEAAQAGDAISLSSGTFQAVDITKAVSICGAGMENDSEAGTQRTTIVGNFDIKDMGVDETNKVILEGLYMDNRITIANYLNNASFIKCRFNEIKDAGISNINIMHCKIMGGIQLSAYNSTCNVFNSFVMNPSPYDFSVSTYFSFKNCFLYFEGRFVFNDTYYLAHLQQSTFENCIIYSYNTGSTQVPIHETCKATYCVGNKSSMFNNQSGLENKVPSNSNFLYALFGITNNSVTEETTFVLTEDAAATYLGSDGTQVGMYGGGTPFNTQPANPKITKCIVAGQTAADGTLSVDIEVVGAE